MIDPEEAALVRRIFELSASGMGYLKIATTLNREGVKNPAGQDRNNATKRSDQFSASGIKAILGRELYRGKLVYGRTGNRWTPDGRKKERGDKVVTVERPDLQIIEEPLWRAAHQRMAAAYRQHLRATGGQLYGKPSAGVEGKHLLSARPSCGTRRPPWSTSTAWRSAPSRSTRSPCWRSWWAPSRPCATTSTAIHRVGGRS